MNRAYEREGLPGIKTGVRREMRSRTMPSRRNTVADPRATVWKNCKNNSPKSMDGLWAWAFGEAILRKTITAVLWGITFFLWL